MTQSTEERLIAILERQEQFVSEIEARFMQLLAQSEARIESTNKMILELSEATHRQTETFILQIDKLSRRLDTREEDCRQMELIALEQGRRIDRVLQILNDATRTQPSNQYNNM